MRRVLPTGLLLFALGLLPGFDVVKAETRVERPVSLFLEPNNVCMNSNECEGFAPLVGLIRGSGYIDFTDWILQRADSSDLMDQNLTVQTVVVEMEGQTQLPPNIIGAHSANGTFYPCCTSEALEAKLCSLEDNDYPLIVKTEKEDIPNDYFVEVYHVNVSAQLSESKSFEFEGYYPSRRTTHAAVVVATCGSPYAVAITGTITFVSYISFSTLPFLVVLSIAHGALALYYYRLMEANTESRIPLEIWIYRVLVLAFGAMLTRTGVDAILARTTHEPGFVRAVFILVEIIKTMASRSLYLVVALGWGVTMPTLPSTMTWIVVGACAIVGLLEFLVGLQLEFDKLDLPGFVFTGIFYLNLAVMVAIPMTLQYTIGVLTSSSQEENHKITRFRWMLRIFYLAIVLKILFITIVVTSRVEGKGDEKFDAMSIKEGDEIIYLVVLACIAYLWRPNPQALKYGYVLLDEEEEGANDLELTMTASSAKDDEPESAALPEVS